MNSKIEKLKPPFKIHGSKKYLSKWILENLPELTGEEEYIEPYCGTASVLINKEKSQLEVINDIDPGIVSIFRALRDECSAFVKKLKKIEYTKESFEKALTKIEFNNNLNYATNEFILRRMSKSGMKKSFSCSDSGDNNTWVTMIDELPIISKRIKNCFIFNKPAIDVIKAFNHENTVCYADPPCLQETRISPDSPEYEMTTDDHIELAKVLIDFKGKAIISGYHSTLYKRLYKEWKCIKKIIPNNTTQTKNKTKKTECIWMNY